MIDYPSSLPSSPIEGDRASTGHVGGLDAWLHSMAVPTASTPVVPPPEAAWAAHVLLLSCVYDTSTPDLPSGIRAVVHHGRRHLLFAAGQYEVVLQVRADGTIGRSRLVGQVLHDGLPLAGVALRLRGADSMAAAMTDRTGGFCLASLAAGSYGLDARVADGIVRVPLVALGPAQATDTKGNPPCARP
jgi:hypothetical protein